MKASFDMPYRQGRRIKFLKILSIIFFWLIDNETHVRHIKMFLCGKEIKAKFIT